ncbi:conserved hypothetical protein [Ricinus communis]|uniref:Uncharacterized protein n=1 Tax=Ricinus communis TaxID=3988 RepID=B9RAM5_RICCO|nr:conserved hypothetical protein [Ricinus communis]
MGRGPSIAKRREIQEFDPPWASGSAPHLTDPQTSNKSSTYFKPSGLVPHNSPVTTFGSLLFLMEY